MSRKDRGSLVFGRLKFRGLFLWKMSKGTPKGVPSALLIGQNVLHLAVQYVADAGEDICVNTGNIAITPFINYLKASPNSPSQFVSGNMLCRKDFSKMKGNISIFPGNKNKLFHRIHLPSFYPIDIVTI